MSFVRRSSVYLLIACVPLFPASASGQSPESNEDLAAAAQHDHAQMNMGSGWQFMQDGVLFGVFNHQGGEHGSNGVTAPNWWMGMATRKVGASQLTLNGMFSLDPATVGTAGYAEIFQVGEVLNGRPLINRQHPHDLFMQLAAIWRTPVTSNTGFTIAGGPVGEPALGPVAYMHRASIAEYPFAPLSHHTFDSTHVSFGVVTAAIDHGPFVLEGSVFNGREPDQNRWDFDFGPLDSVSGRLWYRPDDQWEFQISTGHLTQPEALDPANVERTTATGSWLRRNGSDFDAISFGWGVNIAEGVSRNAVYGEATHHVGENSLFTRLEALQLETELLLTDTIPTTPAAIALKSPVGAFTFGGVRDVIDWGGFEGGIGAAVTFYAVPDVLAPAYGSHPVSFQIYFRLRPPAGKMGRMWNMRMSQPMAGHVM
jgi:hypothetical protein